MLLSDAAPAYVRAVDGSDGYRKQLLWAITAVEKFAGRRLHAEDVSHDLLSSYLHATREHLAPATRRSRRNMLLRLCQHLGAPVTAPRVKVPPPIPHAWSADQVRQLLAAANRSRRAHYWRAYILTAWDTGLRRCDLWRLRAADIGPASVIRQKKTGKPLPVWLRERTIAALRQLPGQHPLAPWCTRSVWQRIAQRLIRRAGLTGCIGWLRHSAATAVELQHPGKGYLFAGNTPEVFYRHYFDRSHADPLQPEEL